MAPSGFGSEKSRNGQQPKAQSLARVYYVLCWRALLLDFCHSLVALMCWTITRAGNLLDATMGVVQPKFRHKLKNFFGKLSRFLFEDCLLQKRPVCF
jgi:hypothetical protein